MSGKWFTNRGQIIQTVLAAVACIFTAKEAIRDILSNQLFTSGPIIFLVLLVLFFFSLSRLGQQNGTPAQIVLPKVPDAKPAQEDAQPPMKGDIKQIRTTIKAGDFWEYEEDKELRVEVLKISPAKGKSNDHWECVVEIRFQVRGHRLFANRYAREVERNHFALQVPSDPSMREHMAVDALHFSERRLRVFNAYVHHVNLLTKEVTLMMAIGLFERPWR